MRPEFQVGQFVLERKIGEGGMAEVWLGRNVHLGSLAAVKFLNDQFAARKDIEERFLNEGRRHGALDHPNIVKVYGFDYAEGRSFLIMQYVDGEALDTLLLRTGPLAINQAWPLAHGILNALEFAHSRQIVHRDVKPSNVLIDRQGTPYLGDFGIVLAVKEKRLTQTGTVMGTPHYMSPEQIARPMEVDHRSDIYSFGCLLYEMLTGATPFDHVSGAGGDTDFAVKTAHLQTPPPPPRQRNPAISPAVEQVVMRCLAKDPNHRFATCGQVREALTLAVYGRVEPPKKKSPVWPWLAGAATFVALAIAFAAFLLWPEQPVVESFTAAPASIRQGQGTLLRWNVQHATEVEIIGLGMQPATGSAPIIPTAKTVYRLVGRNRWRSVNRDVEVEVTPIPPVEIRSFSISPGTIRPNETATVSWDVAGASVVTIGGKQVTASGKAEVRVGETSRYELIARGEDGRERKEQRELKVIATPVISAAPEIIEFSFTPNVIRVGEATTLRWNVRGAKTIKIGQMDALTPSGTKEERFKQSVTSTLVAVGENGKTTRLQIKVQVLPASAPIIVTKPQVTLFRAEGVNGAPGNPVLLHYATMGAARVSIEPGLPALRNTSGTATVFPMQTTKYKLTAYGGNNTTDVWSLVVNINVPLPVPSLAGPWRVMHHHVGYGVKNCQGSLFVRDGRLLFESRTANDGFNLPFDLVEVKASAVYLGSRRPFTVKTPNRNYNFETNDIDTVVAEINRAMGR